MRNSDINLDGMNLEIVTAFTYLGATVVEDGYLDADITYRVAYCQDGENGREHMWFWVSEEST